jgi:Protein of unknown function (DUF3775)
LRRAVETPEGASNTTDDNFMNALTTSNDHPVRAELRGFLQALEQDESTELVALCWLGRGDFTKEETDDAVTAADQREGPRCALCWEWSRSKDCPAKGLATLRPGLRSLRRRRASLKARGLLR